MAGIFKAYDIRGVVGEFLTPQVAYFIGRALAARVFQTGDTLALTRDMRTHSPQMFDELSRGLREGGVSTIEIGLAPTPMNYWAINHFQSAGGVQVTASHNGPTYNGFKVSGAGAVPLDYDGALRQVEEYVLDALQNGTPTSANPQAIAANAQAAVADAQTIVAQRQAIATNAQSDATDAQGDANNAQAISTNPQAIAAQTQGAARGVQGALASYLDWMGGFCSFGDRKLRIGIDAGNGMGGFFLADFFARHPNFELVPLFFDLDGTFPNHEADPLKPENLRDIENLVREQHLDLGVAFDGDADRCMFVDENGTSISSDLITALIAGDLLEATPGPILYDLRSSKAVPEWIEEHGGRPVRGRVGHTFMKRLLKESSARFGGELSGHYYFADCFHTDSGLMALVQILNALTHSEKPLSERVAPLRRYSATGEINYRVADVPATLAKLQAHYASQNATIDHLDGLSVELGDIKTGGWWFNLRSSNTEPLLRLNLEARTPTERDARLAEVQELLGALPATGH